MLPTSGPERMAWPGLSLGQATLGKTFCTPPPPHEGQAQLERVWLAKGDGPSSTARQLP